MKAVKKVEIVADALEAPRLLALLEDIRIEGYTVVRDAHGEGERGTRAGDVFTGAFDNNYVMIACNEGQAARIVETVRPVLERPGGICLVSDAMRVPH